jgi:hypothetical protein
MVAPLPRDTNSWIDLTTMSVVLEDSIMGDPLLQLDGFGR